MTDNIARILKTLTTRTLAKEAIWINTARDTEYQLRLPSGRITVDHWFQPGQQGPEEFADFRIYNSDGLEIASESGEPGSEDFKQIVSLHDAIVTRKLNVNETLAGLEKDILAQGTIGDEIPF